MNLDRLEPLLGALARCFALVAAGTLTLVISLGLLSAWGPAPRGGAYEVWAYLTYPGLFGVIAVAAFAPCAYLRHRRHEPVLKPPRVSPVAALTLIWVGIEMIPHYAEVIGGRIRARLTRYREPPS